MARLFKSDRKEVKEFGKLGFVGTQKMDKPIIEALQINESEVHLESFSDLSKFTEYRKNHTPRWLNIMGLHDSEMIERLGEAYDVHPMILDKISNTEARSSFEDYDEYIVLTLKMLHFNEAEMEIESEHITFILLEDRVVTFQEHQDHPFGPIMERLKKETSRIRKSGADYLMLSLVRAIINQYSIILEKIGDKIENLEESIFADTSNNLLEELTTYNAEMSYMHKIIRPAKEAITLVCKSDSDLIDREKSQYILNHLMDSVNMISETSDSYRMMLHDQLNIYHTNVASKLNEMFRILTIFSVIFVPLTFLAGIYGMNFENIPELSYHYGYHVVWAIMITMAIGMLIYFRRKGWL
ncbi:MAG: magnesium/cobalt transporter CorA [Schleiferiaceae bacterium]|jgi:magnesium transporter|nr:magnesium/cobalt transporter CorA [Schleiferiaceae bacterium]